MPKRNDTPGFKSIAEFAAARDMRDHELAAFLRVDRSQATKLRRGKKYRSLIEPLRIARACGVPIEALAPKSAA